MCDQREMSLVEWCEKLISSHVVNKELNLVRETFRILINEYVDMKALSMRKTLVDTSLEILKINRNECHEKQTEGMIDEVYFEMDGKMYCDEDSALSVLLREELIFANGRQYLSLGKNCGETVVLFVMCNDLFAWGMADAENLPYSEIENLYKMYEKDNEWGTLKWCCFQRDQQPQKPIIDLMKKDGVWDEKMQELKKNTYNE